MSQRIYTNWGVSSFFGWGVYGLNLALHWSQEAELAPICTVPIDRAAVGVDPLRLRALEPFLRRSSAFHAEIEPFSGGRASVDGPMLCYFDHQFKLAPSAHSVWLTGKPSLAVTFFETAVLDEDAVRRAAAYPLVVAGSTWNAEVLRAHGLQNVRTVIQGVDPTLFHPAPRLGHLADRFLVFSGGKLERRKGQDIVMAAFRRFAETHPEALLVTAWHSPWPEVARTLDDGSLTAPVIFESSGQVHVPAWAAVNGVGPQNLLSLGAIPNAQLPAVLREMDVAVFPNRAEGGTNLVAMECMACGVPTILSRNTGHLDLIEDDNCYPLVQQGVLAGREGPFGDVAGWGESAVDEVVEQLERAYRHRAEARERGLRGAASLAKLTWARTAAEMKSVVLQTSAGAPA